ncbi:MAG: GNAT family N-acetyltransferase [Candidatus Parabeggiatoa sp. nov. 2]|nr:MAG: hypothetical protein B6247_00680 [Beggiatoa sp. 4572_84]RKZ64175.1 MAG: GNAT family N-acetyltransferase [Gammaproteobacteria bacterium]HEC84052.1 GNAT family N-acetyltransferase [Thioploca sp.]
MMDKNFTIKPAHWPDDAAALRMIRETVFVKELGVPQELEWDGHDQEATHVLAVFLAGDVLEKPIGTGRLLPDGQIGRMAVLKDWRGLGVGTAMLKMLLRQACAKGLKNVFLNAQLLLKNAKTTKKIVELVMFKG